MTIVYHGTQTRHLPGIFSSNKLIGYWSTNIDSGIDYAISLGPEYYVFPPDKESIIVITDIDIINEAEPSGDPTYLTPIEGYIESSRILYGMRYIGPITNYNLSTSTVWNEWKDHKYWKKISVPQMKRYSRISKSIVNGMLFIEPDPIALQFKTLLRNNRSSICQFIGKNFAFEDSFPIYDLTEKNQHDQDNGVDTIIIFRKSKDYLIASRYCSIGRTYDGIDTKMPFEELLKLDRRTRTSKSYQGMIEQ